MSSPDHSGATAFLREQFLRHVAVPIEGAARAWKGSPQALAAAVAAMGATVHRLDNDGPLVWMLSQQVLDAMFKAESKRTLEAEAQRILGIGASSPAMTAPAPSTTTPTPATAKPVPLAVKAGTYDNAVAAHLAKFERPVAEKPEPTELEATQIALTRAAVSRYREQRKS